MKTWKKPEAIGQDFAANDYISACYRVKCTTPNGNKKYTYLYEDTNKNGTFEAGVDQLLFDATSIPNNEHFWGCGGYHDVIIQGDLPTNNGFVAPLEDPYDVVPYFYWSGKVINVTDPTKPNMADMHGTDLTRDDAITDSSNFS